MSIEYTIDIQLTEMGFPDIVQPSEAPAGETPRRSSPSDDSLSAGHKRKRLLQQAKNTSTPPSETLPCKVPDPQSLQQDVKAAALDAPTVKDRTAGPQTPDPPEPQTLDPPGFPGPTADHTYNRDWDAADSAPKDSTEAQEDEDSDDSEVSVACEEEEVEEDEDDEELISESSHSGDYRCTVCDLQLPSKFKLQDHMNQHTGSHPYCCAECGKRFCQFNNYRLHLRTHAQFRLANFQCRICLTCFASKEALTQHLSGTHLEEEFYECDLCKRVFTSLKACENHVETHKNMLSIVCKTCGRSFTTRKALARHLKVPCSSTPCFKCTDCTKIFTRKNALLKHSFSHLGLLPYTCIRCRCHFRLAKLYLQHKCEPERLNCVACLREFPSQRDFEQHKKDTGCWGSQEPKGDEIRCLECGQRFDSAEELKKHAGAHQRVLNCAECGKGFRSALLLMSHMGGHAGKSPCLCQSCGLGFPHQQNYDSHLKTCGQTPRPASAPKKRQPPKSHKTLTPKPDPRKLVPNPDLKPVAPVRDSSSPGPVTKSVSDASRPSEGLWKLSLDKMPPPGFNLVLFLPVSPDGLTLPSIVSPTLPGPAFQVQPEQHDQSAAFGPPQKAPLDLVTRFKQDPQCEAALDLSQKCNSSRFSLSDIPIKSETEEYEVSADGTGRGSKVGVKTNPVETDTVTEGKEFKTDPMDLSRPRVEVTPSGLKVNIKDEPQSTGPAFDSWPSANGQPMEKKVKMEVDV